jgi:homoserine dehydrogenase
MTRNGQDFAAALAEAQLAGYAEADPSADVDGLDAAYKLSILSSIAFGTRVAIEDVYVEGIRQIGATDIKYADELGYVIKLLAIGKEEDGRVSVRVHPTFVPKSHPLAAVNSVYNAVFVRGDAVGELMFYGRGAGDEPTGSAVIADLVDIGRNLKTASSIRNCTCYYEKPITSMDETFTRYYIRMEVKDQPGVLAQIASAFGTAGVSLASVIQKGHGTEPVTLVFVSHGVREIRMQQALSAIRTLPSVFEINSVIRVEV